ncbi:MAG: hypothetical protein ACEQSD_08110 [Flavobacteriales bacterium]
MNTRQNTHSSRWLVPMFALGLLVSGASQASDTGRTAAAGALGGVIGATVGQQIGGQTGALIGAGIGAGGAALGSSIAADRAR